ncbi:restriction endonuclease subunit S [Amycolatopsis sp. NPDC004772]
MAIAHGAKVHRIAEIAETQLGKMLDSKRTEGTQTEYLRNVNVRWQSFDLSSILTVPLTSKEQQKFSLKHGDILVCEGGQPGRCAVWRGSHKRLAFQKALHRVRVHDGIVAEWVSLMIEHAVRSGATERLLTGSTIKHLPQEKLRAISVPVPNERIQQVLVQEIAEAENAQSRLASELATMSARADRLRRSLLADAFSGRIVPQDPNDEPASVLLDRIRTERAAEPRPKRTRRAKKTNQETLL